MGVPFGLAQELQPLCVSTGVNWRTSMQLSHYRIAVLATDGFEEVELTEPVRALKDIGAQIDIISNHDIEIQSGGPGQQGRRPTNVRTRVDRVLSTLVRPEDYDALFLPGGQPSAEALSRDPQVLEFVKSFQDCDKPIAFISYSGLILAAAGLVRDRRLTAHPDIREILVSAGAVWQNEEVINDNNWVSSRGVRDLPAFIHQVREIFSKVQPLISYEARRNASRSRIA